MFSVDFHVHFQFTFSSVLIFTYSIKTMASDLKDKGIKDYFSRSACVTLICIISAMGWFPGSNTGRLVGGMWLLSSLIFAIVYRSNLKAMLIIPKV